MIDWSFILNLVAGLAAWEACRWLWAKVPIVYENLRYLYSSRDDD